MLVPAATELAPFYYRDNFLRLCDTVEAQYADILAAPERAFLRRFRQLGFKAQCLYVRLVSRVGPWFRESKLGYPELGAPGPLLDILLDQAMLLSAEGLTAQEQGKLFTRDELQRAYRGQLPPTKWPDKSALLNAIDSLSLVAAESLHLLAGIDPGRLVAPLGAQEVQVLQLLFFGNRRQSLTEFVLSDLGVARYYPYLLDREHRLFTQRPAVEEYLDCAALSDAWYELRDVGDASDLLALAQEVLSRDVIFSSSQSRWYRLCNGLARDLERLGELAAASQLYGRSRRHPARERRARLLERGEDFAAAAALCRDILDGPWCEEEQQAAERILPRVRRKLDGSRVPRQRDSFAQMNLRLRAGKGPVEQQVADHLGADWQAVRYVENKLMNALFGLAFWEQIFAPVPGAFHNPYQSVPTDMYTPDFRLRRQASLEARLGQLRQGDLAVQLRQAYDDYAGYQCQWVDWRQIDASLVEMALRVIPAEHLLAIWRRMLFDPRENRRGFPDLIAIGDKPTKYCLIEVKGPGDALQDSQKRWLRFFATQHIPAQVAWVEWCGD